MLEGILPVLGFYLRIVLAIMFAAAAVAKIRNRDEFHGVVRNFRLLPEALDRAFAATLPWIELAIAGSLLIGGGLLGIAGFAAAGLLGLFAIAIGINILRGRKEIDCGCFRQGLKQGLSWLLVARNAVLVAASLFVAVHPAMSQATGLASAAIATAAAAASILLYFSVTQLQALWRLPSSKSPIERMG